MSKINIRKALVSVSDKSLLEKIGEYFLKYSIIVMSTGGTYNFLKKKFPSLKLQEIADFTNFKEILDGRVKHFILLFMQGFLQRKMTLAP